MATSCSIVHDDNASHRRWRIQMLVIGALGTRAREMHLVTACVGGDMQPDDKS